MKTHAQTAQAIGRWHGMARLCLMLVVGLLAPSTWAKGYGDLEWGTSVAKARKKRPTLRPSPGAEDVAFEREALDAITDVERLKASAKGAKAVKRWQRESAKRLKPRFSAWSQWLRLDGLKARTHLHFFDGRLYGATLRVLVPYGKRSRADALIETLGRTYGPATQTESGRPLMLRFSTPGGTLIVHKLLATKRRNGMLRLAYRADEWGRRANRRREALEGRLRWARSEQAKTRRTRAGLAQRKRDRRLLDHL